MTPWCRPVSLSRSSAFSSANCTRTPFARASAKMRPNASCAFLRRSILSIVLSVFKSSRTAFLPSYFILFLRKKIVQPRVRAREIQIADDRLEPRGEIVLGDGRVLALGRFFGVAAAQKDFPLRVGEFFLSNPEEDALLNTQEYQKKVAYALYKGIVAFIAHNVAG